MQKLINSPPLYLVTLYAFGFLLTSCRAPKSDLELWVDKIDSHLTKNEGGQLIAQAMDAHGGLTTWLQNEVIEFRWVYHMNDVGPNARTDTLQRVDTSTFHAVHEVTDSTVKFGWTGTEAWQFPADSPTRPHPRFWALTPYYFVGIPFVFADMNANFEKLESTFDFEGTAYNQVKITFNPGTGDAPDDYYIVQINPVTGMVGGARYIVTSPIVARNGPIPEKLITLENYSEVGGIKLPTSHRSFNMAEDRPTEHIRNATASGYRWLKRSEVDFSAPEGSAKF